VVIINDVSMARRGATTLVALIARLLRDRKIPVTMLVGDEKQKPEFEARDVEIVELGRARLLDRGSVSEAVGGIWNSSASPLVDQWIEPNDTPPTVYQVHVFSQILSSSIFNVLRRVAGRTVIHAQDFFHACPNGAFMDHSKNEICRRTSLGISCPITNCDRLSYPQKLWRVGRQFALNYAMSSNLPWAKLILSHQKMAPFFRLARYESEMMAVVGDPAEASPSRFPVILTNQALLAEEIVENELGAACDRMMSWCLQASSVPLTGCPETWLWRSANMPFQALRSSQIPNRNGRTTSCRYSRLWSASQPITFREVNVGYVSQI
jgi:hypothetical protein